MNENLGQDFNSNEENRYWEHASHEGMEANDLLHQIRLLKEERLLLIKSLLITNKSSLVFPSHILENNDDLCRVDGFALASHLLSHSQDTSRRYIVRMHENSSFSDNVVSKNGVSDSGVSDYISDDIAPEVSDNIHSKNHTSSDSNEAIDNLEIKEGINEIIDCRDERGLDNSIHVENPAIIDVTTPGDNLNNVNDSNVPDDSEKKETNNTPSGNESSQLSDYSNSDTDSESIEDIDSSFYSSTDNLTPTMQDESTPNTDSDWIFVDRGAVSPTNHKSNERKHNERKNENTNERDSMRFDNSKNRNELFKSIDKRMQKMIEDTQERRPSSGVFDVVSSNLMQFATTIFAIGTSLTPEEKEWAEWIDSQYDIGRDRDQFKKLLVVKDINNCLKHIRASRKAYRHFNRMLDKFLKFLTKKYKVRRKEWVDAHLCTKVIRAFSNAFAIIFSERILENMKKRNIVYWSISSILTKDIFDHLVDLFMNVDSNRIISQKIKELAPHVTIHRIGLTPELCLYRKKPHEVYSEAIHHILNIAYTLNVFEQFEIMFTSYCMIFGEFDEYYMQHNPDEFMKNIIVDSSEITKLIAYLFISSGIEEIPCIISIVNDIIDRSRLTPERTFFLEASRTALNWIASISLNQQYLREQAEEIETIDSDTESIEDIDSFVSTPISPTTHPWDIVCKEEKKDMYEDSGEDVPSRQSIVSASTSSKGEDSNQKLHQSKSTSDLSQSSDTDSIRKESIAQPFSIQQLLVDDLRRHLEKRRKNGVLDTSQSE